MMPRPNSEAMDGSYPGHSYGRPSAQGGPGGPSARSGGSGSGSTAGAAAGNPNPSQHSNNPAMGMSHQGYEGDMRGVARYSMGPPNMQHHHAMGHPNMDPTGMGMSGYPSRAHEGMGGPVQGGGGSSGGMMSSTQHSGSQHMGNFPAYPQEMSPNMPRNDLILVSMGNVRAVVGLNELILMDAHQAVVQEFAHEMSDIFREEALDTYADPPELLFLDEVLRDTVDAFSRRLSLYEPIVENFLNKVSDEVYSDTGVHLLVPLKDSLQSFEIQVKQSVECLATLLNNDDAMLDLLLTEQAAAEKRGSQVDFERQ